MTFNPTFYGLFIDENEADSPHMAIAVNDNDPSLFIDECLLMELDMGIQMILVLLTAPFVQNQSVSVVRKLSVCMPTPFPKSA